MSMIIIINSAHLGQVTASHVTVAMYRAMAVVPESNIFKSKAHY